MPFLKKLTHKIQHPAIYVALGANQAYRGLSLQESLRKALLQLSKRGVTPVSASNIWKTPAWPDPADPEFANAVVEVHADLSPQHLMSVLHEVEAEFGRERLKRNAPRTLDLDLVDYNGLIMDEGLVLPHPRASDRAFVLLPLQDIAPGWRDPVSGRSIQELIEALPDKDKELCERLDQTIWP